MSELSLPACPICHAKDSLVRQTMDRGGKAFVWYECGECGSVLLWMADGQWSYQRVGREESAYMLKRPMTAGQLRELLASYEQAPAITASVKVPQPAVRTQIDDALQADGGPVAATGDHVDRSTAGERRGLPLGLVIVLMVFACVAGIVLGTVGVRFVLPSHETIEIGQVVPTLTPYPTATSYPTYTPYTQPSPYPTYTPHATYTPYPSPLPEPALPPTSQPGGVGPVGTIVVDSWRYEITDVRVERGLDPSRKVILLLGYLTNEGMKTDGFVAFGSLVLQDSQGRQYEDDHQATWMGEDKYDAESKASIDPGATRYVAIGYDVLANETQFTIIPGSLVASWSGNISFTLP